MTDDKEQKLVTELQQPNVGKTGEQSKSEPKNDGDVLLNDLQWGQKTLQKFLTTFGFF